MPRKTHRAPHCSQYCAKDPINRLQIVIVLLCFILPHNVVASQLDTNSDQENDNEETFHELPDCLGGICPTPLSDEGNDCGLWLGPSPIKDVEEHGFGLGIFTGRRIPKGSLVESIYSDAGETLIPIFSSKIHKTHPPLREYVWESGHLPEIAKEVKSGTTFYFIPGLAAIAP
jgi:hypothetical protein